MRDANDSLASLGPLPGSRHGTFRGSGYYLRFMIRDIENGYVSRLMQVTAQGTAHVEWDFSFSESRSSFATSNKVI